MLTSNWRGIKKVNVEEARILLITLTKELLDRINSDQQIRPYLDHYPFTEKGISLGLSFYDDQGKRVDNGYVAHLFVAKDGNICYDTYNHEEDLYEEPYEEALRIVENEQKSVEKATITTT